MRVRDHAKYASVLHSSSCVHEQPKKWLKNFMNKETKSIVDNKPYPLFDGLIDNQHLTHCSYFSEKYYATCNISAGIICQTIK